MDKLSKAKLGERIASYRKALGLTQKDVSKQLGVSQPYYSQIEKGFHELRDNRIKLLSEILKVAPSDLLKENITHEKQHRELLPGDPGSDKFFDQFQLYKGDHLQKALLIIQELITELDYQHSLMKSAKERNQYLRNVLKENLESSEEQLKDVDNDDFFKSTGMTKSEYNEFVQIRIKTLGLDINDPLDSYVGRYEEFKSYINKKLDSI